MLCISKEKFSSLSSLALILKSMKSKTTFPLLMKTFTDNIHRLLPIGADSLALNGRGELPLHLAARQGHEKTLEALLQHYSKIEKSDVVNAFPKAPDNEESTVRVSQSNALHSASFHGHARCVELLLRHGAHHLLNGAELYPIHIAAKQKQVACIRIMLAHGGKSLVTALSGNEYNALQYVCMTTHAFDKKAIACACLLINAGIDLNAAPQFDERLCPLYLAARNGACELVYYLLQSGVDVNIEVNFNERQLANTRIAEASRVIKLFQSIPVTLLIASRVAIRRQLLNGNLASAFLLPTHNLLQYYIFHGHANTDGLCDP